MAQKRNTVFEASPGQLYKGITSVSEPFEGETKTMVEPDHPFVVFCKSMYKRFPSFGANAEFSEKHKEAVSFLGWRMTPAHFMAALKGTAVIAAIPSIIFLVLFLLFEVGIQAGSFNSLNIVPGIPTIAGMLGAEMATQMFMLLAAVVFGAIGAGVYFIYSFPINAANEEKNRALTYVPEMIGYLIMSMKLVPNLEKAIEFSAKHGRGKIALDFKRLIWDFQIGLFSSISEGLDLLAYRWGAYSTELKESLMKIRACVMEPSESRRYGLLDKTMLEVLDSVKMKMEDYARGLNQPSVMLFYMGVLLPLLLIIILPVGSAFSGAPLARPEILVVLYCIAIPVAAFTFANKVVKSRPSTYEPPEITDSFSELPPKWRMVMKRGSLDIRVAVAIILVAGISLSFFLSTQGFPPKSLVPIDNEGRPYFQLLPADGDLYSKLQEQGKDPTYFGVKTFDLFPVSYFLDESMFLDRKQGSGYKTLVSQGLSEKQADDRIYMEYLQFTSDSRNDPTKYIFWSGIILTIVFAACFSLYYRNIYKRRAQLGIMQMEDEFKESMYMIASRMGENKPVESALKQAKDYLPNLMISKRIFGKTMENIELMGLPLEAAIFDPLYGSMKGIPSKTLTTAMRLLVDSVSLGVEVASRTLMSLSLQMENMDKVNKSLKDLVSDVTTTMTTMALFIAPIVLGITVALQKVVLKTLSGIVADPSMGEGASVSQSISDIGGTASFNVNSLFQVNLDSFKSFASPLVFLIVVGIYVIEIVIIMLYFTTKVQEDNDLLFRINLAKSLPIAAIIFVVTVLGANLMIGVIMGGQ